MKLASVAAIVFSGGLAVACASHITEVQAGMSESAVIDALGKPDSREIQGRLTELTYERHAVSGWRLVRDDYFVRLNDGKVVAFGPTEQHPR